MSPHEVRTFAHFPRSQYNIIKQNYGGLIMELTYTKHDDYYLPDLDIPAQEKVSINRYGRMHGSYLRKNNRTAYNELLFSGRLNRYLAELGEQAEKMLALLTEQYAAAENVTEEMKAADQMGWVRAMNSIRNRAEEVVISELVYC